MPNAISLDSERADSFPDAAPRRRRRITRETIIDSAERLFVEGGYRGTRVSEVARSADVSIGSIYAYFENKEGLYAALLERALAIETVYFDAIFDDETTPDFEKILLIGEAYLQFFRDYPAFFRMLMAPHEDLPAEAAETEISVRVGVRGMYQLERLQAVIQRCVDQGILRGDVDPASAANFWWAAWSGMIALTMRRDPLQVTPERLAEVVLEGRRMIAQGMAGSVLREPDGRIIKPVRDRLSEIRYTHP